MSYQTPTSPSQAAVAADTPFPGPAGSLWHDTGGDPWVVGEDGMLQLACSPHTPAEVMRTFGPMKRVVKKPAACSVVGPGPQFADETFEMLNADAPGGPARAVVEYWHNYANAISDQGRNYTWATVGKVTGHIAGALDAEPPDEAVDTAFELATILDHWAEFYGSDRLPMGEDSMPAPRLRMLVNAPRAYARAAAELAVLREALDKTDPIGRARSRLLASLAATNSGTAPLAERLLTNGLRHLRALEQAGVEAVGVTTMLDMLDLCRELPEDAEVSGA